MSLANFGDVAANQAFPTQEFWAHYTGTTTVNNATNADVTWLAFTMPFTGIMIATAAVCAHFSAGGLQNLTLQLSASADEPDVAPVTWSRSQAASSAGYYQFTVPVAAKWNSVSSGTSLSIHAAVSVGAGGLNCIIDWIAGSARCFRTV